MINWSHFHGGEGLTSKSVFPTLMPKVGKDTEKAGTVFRFLHHLKSGTDHRPSFPLFLVFGGDLLALFPHLEMTGLFDGLSIGILRELGSLRITLRVDPAQVLLLGKKISLVSTGISVSR